MNRIQCTLLPHLIKILEELGKGSVYLYLSMSYDMDNKGYEGMVSWFALQAKEEFEHATRFMKFIGEMDREVILMPVEEVLQKWNTPKDAFEDTLMLEKVATGKIHKLVNNGC